MSKHRLLNASSKPISQPKETTRKFSESQNLVTSDLVTCFAALRTKGGSGERHLVKRLFDIEKEKDQEILVVRVVCDNVFEYNELPLGNHIEFSDIQHGVTEGHLVWDWTDITKLNLLLKLVSENATKKTTIIFTHGTNSGGRIFKWLPILEPHCQQVILSINTEVKQCNDVAEKIFTLITKDNWVSAIKVSFGLWAQDNQYNQVAVSDYRNSY
ncbi:hypothetical protein [Pseudoalteromonas umbrosa]|uniref:hypothetical protein n=1 Tax=Pseudoalteromonas umbrosa TaxID=3048489 RepID=UPI0024C2E513|nr:hypothetical protein [Pseudoalteromonas sp. B95]MDK1287429.1 hypothetical protein [Pseudoalteromonas sp. B95]